MNTVRKLTSPMTNLIISNYFVDRIKVTQTDDEEWQKLLTSLELVKKRDDGVIKFKGRLCVPFNEWAKKQSFTRGTSFYVHIHLGVTKIYQDMEMIYWWSGMKKDVIEFVAKCLVRQQVKFEHQRSRGQLQPPKILSRNRKISLIIL